MLGKEIKYCNNISEYSRLRSRRKPERKDSIVCAESCSGKDRMIKYDKKVKEDLIT